MSTAPTDGRRRAAAERRRKRQIEMIVATRELFDQRGVRDAQIDDIARAVGVNRAIVYRHFAGKEDLFSLALVEYLDELHDRLADASGSADDPVARLEAIVSAFVDYGVTYPAFVDCAQSLMGRSGADLLLEVSQGALFRLGRGISSCLAILSGVLDEGIASGDFHIDEDDSVLVANMLYATGLGALQLARVGILVREAAPGIPTLGTITAEQARTYLVRAALAHAGAPIAH